MSSTDTTIDAEANGTNDRQGPLSRVPLPSTPFFYGVVGLGFLFILVGSFFASGEFAGLYGIWGLSLIVTAVLVYVAYGVWYVMD